MTVQIEINKADTQPQMPQTDSLSALSAKLMQPQIKLPIMLMLLVSLTIGGAIGWAAWARVVEVTVGSGKVIPASKIQLIQNLEGGIVSEILTGDGRKVLKGDLLLRIDPTSAGSSLEEMQDHMVSLEASSIRLQAIMDGKKPTYSSEFVATNPLLVQRNLSEYQASLAQVNASKSAILDQIRQKKLEQKEAEVGISSIGKSLEIAREELQLQKNLKKNQATSRADVLTALGKVSELEGRVAQLKLTVPRLSAAIDEANNRLLEIESRFRTETAAKLNDAMVKLNAMRSASKANRDRVERADIRSPVDGIIKILHANTIGQVIKSGENIIEIVPADDKLVVQAMVRPQDIAFLHPGQDVVIKVTAYDYTLFGALEGKLTRIGADSIVDEKGNAHFLVDVHSNKSFLERDGVKLPIIPGMVAQVDIVTGDKTILSYLTKPMHRMASNAFRER